MLSSRENNEIRSAIVAFEKRIESMHLEFYKYYQGVEKRQPDWERLERELIDYSRKMIYDTVLSQNMDRVLYKFQNRKKIWLNWAEEAQHVVNGQGDVQGIEEEEKDPNLSGQS